MPQGERDFLVSHASVPFAEAIAGGLHRIWFSPRDARNRSHVASLVVDLREPERILELSDSVVLGPGPLGAFDDCGAMMSWIAGEGAQRGLYYIGWNIRTTVPFHVTIGVAREQPDGSWRRHDAPILDRGIDDPWFCSNPCVLSDEEGWQMWYLAGRGWEEVSGRLSPSYDVRHARSQDGLRWFDRGRNALGLEGDEFAIARPSVLRDAEGYTMWACARSRTRPYRLIAARSTDGIAWRRAPELAELPPAATGWDSEMIAYPHVFLHLGRRWMLYCGNGFGQSGFGLAVWD